MKKFNLFKMLAVLIVLIASINTAWAANTYKITGSNGNLTGWGTWQDMTVSTDGFYEYFTAASGNCECKINTSESYDGAMGEYYNTPGFNSTTVGNGTGTTWTDGNHNANYWYNGGNYYILIYYPNTGLNTSGDPVICASTTLPNDVPSVSLAASPTTEYCGGEITFTATPSKLYGKSATYTFTDITGGGSTTIQSASTSATCTHAWTTSGTKTVQVTMTVGDNDYTDDVEVTVKTCYVRGNINGYGDSWPAHEMTYAVSGSGAAYYYHQVTATGQFKILVGNSVWGDNPSASYIKDGDDIKNDIMGADVELSKAGGDNPNIIIDQTGYIVYFPGDGKICAVTSLSNFDGADIDNVALSETTVPPLAVINATPTMIRSRSVAAFCWGVYSDAACTEGNKVATTFTSLGDGKVEFMVPKTTGTYYLKLKVHASDACDAAVDDEEVVSFTVTNERMIYFKNVPNWSNVYVYFYYGDGASGYWDDKKGTGAKKGGKQVCSASTMKRIGKTDIYYYQYGDWSGHVVAFADHEENNNEYFDQCQVAYREDFSTCAQMYVPENYIHDYLNQHDSYRTCYYSSNNANKIRGYWTTYPRTNAGFAIKLYGSADGSQVGGDYAFTQTGTNTYVAEVDLNPATYATYYYNLYACAGDNGVSNTKYTLYGNSGEMEINSSNNWNFYTQIARCRIKPAAAGTYTFKLLLSDDGAVQVTVDYPLAEGDYRLIYTDGDHTPHPSRYIRARAGGLDTISVWINPDATSPVMKVQQCTAVSPVAWDNYDWSGNDATGAIDISSLSRGVYNFYLEQDESSALTVNEEETHAYTGLYYIRSSSVGGGWLGYKTNKDNRMSYTKYAEDKNYGFNYYKAKWVNDAGADVTYTIACDYSESLCDTLRADPDNKPLSASQAASIPHNANIRFGWNSLDNTLQRAYINGSSTPSDRYLVLLGEENKIADKNGNAFSVSGLSANETTFTDLNNWIYRIDLKAKPNAGVKVTAKYDNEEQYFIGDKDNYDEIIGNSADQWWPLRVIYDFKTNRLLASWLADEDTEIGTDLAVKADVMIIRQEQDAAAQITFTDGAKITDVKTVYGVLQLRKDFMTDNEKTIYERALYWISFPFDVKLSEVFGFGSYGTEWGIQYYDGAGRAKNGFWIDSPSNWKFYTPTQVKDSVLHKNVGYLLSVDVDLLGEPSNDIWANNVHQVSLYFPSQTEVSNITETTGSYVVPAHTCSITRDSRNIKDSHWNVIGVPSYHDVAFNDIDATIIHTGDVYFYYAQNWSDNSLTPSEVDDLTFKAMHSYMTQFHGTINWGEGTISTTVAAPRKKTADDTHRLRLTIAEGDAADIDDQTLVRLTDEATKEFDLNKDMTKSMNNNKANVYTLIGNVEIGGNAMPLVMDGVTYIPVGVQVAHSGMYRFSLPDGTDGLEVYLVDQTNDTRTNLMLDDCETFIAEGTNNSRFVLEIGRKNSPTGIVETYDTAGEKVIKFLQDGKLFIQRGGVVHDAQGNRVK